VLVLVSDHGSGTSEFGQALNTHPCVFDVETPFSFSNTLWSKSKLDLPCDATMPHAIFDADTGQMTMTANHQLDSKLITLSQSKTKHVSLTPAEFNGDASPLYSGLRYNLADYFVRIRDLVCKGVPADVCPPSECTVTLQMFPQFINANTAWQEMKEDEPSACTAAACSATSGSGTFLGCRSCNSRRRNSATSRTCFSACSSADKLATRHCA
jgi:hypothetical protein